MMHICVPHSDLSSARILCGFACASKAHDRVCRRLASACRVRNCILMAIAQTVQPAGAVCLNRCLKLIISVCIARLVSLWKILVYVPDHVVVFVCLSAWSATHPTLTLASILVSVTSMNGDPETNASPQNHSAVASRGHPCVVECIVQSLRSYEGLRWQTQPRCHSRFRWS